MNEVEVANITGKPIFVSVCDYGGKLNVHISSKDVDSNHADPTEVKPTKNAVFTTVHIKQEGEKTVKEVEVEVSVPETLPSVKPDVKVDGKTVAMEPAL